MTQKELSNIYNYEDFISLFGIKTPRFYILSNQNIENNHIEFISEKHIIKHICNRKSSTFFELKLDQSAKYRLVNHEKYIMFDCESDPIIKEIKMVDDIIYKIFDFDFYRIKNDLDNNFGYDSFKNCYFEKMDIKLKTATICKYIVSKHWYFLKYIPSEILTPELLQTTIDNFGCITDLVNIISNNLENPDLCKIILNTKCYKTMNTIHKKYLKDNILIEIISECDPIKDINFLSDLKFIAFIKIPRQLPNIINALKNKGLKFIDNNNFDFDLTEEQKISLFKKKISINNNFKDILPEYRTKEICEYALSIPSFTSLSDIPDGLIDFNEEFLIKFLNNYEGVNHRLEFIPHKYLTEKVCMEAVKISGFELEHVPVNLKSKDVCFTAFYNVNDHSKNYVYRNFPAEIKIMFDHDNFEENPFDVIDYNENSENFIQDNNINEDNQNNLDFDKNEDNQNNLDFDKNEGYQNNLDFDKNEGNQNNLDFDKNEGNQNNLDFDKTEKQKHNIQESCLIA